MPVGHAELICYPLEAALIGRRGEIVADRDRGKAACDAFCAQLVDFQCCIGPVSAFAILRPSMTSAVILFSVLAFHWQGRRSAVLWQPPKRHRHTRGRVLRVARSVVWTCRSTLGLAEPPFSSPHTRVTSVPSMASASSTMASEDQPPMLTV